MGPNAPRTRHLNRTSFQALAFLPTAQTRSSYVEMCKSIDALINLPVTDTHDLPMSMGNYYQQGAIMRLQKNKMALALV